ncbi:MAG: LLM class F420-dependent oxidoreductase [Thaumarchaeota archaeon]|nr:LLM class F420-dependent oxidoreductase [Nitrososphaerota archaeon]
MRFGFVLPMLRHRIEPTELPGLAITAEKNGFDSVWTADHIAVPQANSETYGDVIEQLVTLSYIAAKTEKLKVGTSVLVVPQRNPLLVAKQAAALDILSGGRLILGVGAGWIEGEFRILGADFAHRGRILDESIQLMRAMWSEPVVNFSGTFFSVDDAVSFPKPKRQIPIWVGGNSDAALGRAARMGDGWHPIAVAPARVKEGREVIEKTGRKVTISTRSMVSIMADGTKAQAGLSGTRQHVVQQLEEYERAGAEYFLLQSGADDVASVARDVLTFAREILSSF